MIVFTVNGTEQRVEVSPDMLLLWVLRGMYEVVPRLSRMGEPFVLIALRSGT